MKTITPTELRSNIYQILDEILDTGIPIEVDKGGKKLLIKPIEHPNKLQNLKKRKNVIKGDPNDLINLTWEKEINLDLP
ncbi:MAG: hypothetical protein ACI8V2_002762 [Candidatus Latescibacterota bacterium]|jgi:hypothetical protein